MMGRSYLTKLLQSVTIFKLFKGNTMSYACEICGKGKQFGHNVPFSQKKTNKVWKPNLQRKRLVVDGTPVRVKMCTQCMRTLEKYDRETKAAEEARSTSSGEARKYPAKETAKA
jgi:large subunit ribosomal protein L28